MGIAKKQIRTLVTCACKHYEVSTNKIGIMALVFANFAPLKVLGTAHKLRISIHKGGFLKYSLSFVNIKKKEVIVV